MMAWLPEAWIIRILFFLIAYYAINSQVDRAIRKADAASIRASKAEQELENALSDIRMNANECVELRKRVSYLEEKLDEFTPVLELLAVPAASKSTEDVTSERVMGMQESSCTGTGNDGPNGTSETLQSKGLSLEEHEPVLQHPQPRQKRVEYGLMPQQLQLQHHQPHRYTPYSSNPVNEPVGRSSVSSEQSASSGVEKTASLRSKIESGRESVMSALNSFPGRKSHRGSRSGRYSVNSTYNVVPGTHFGRVAKISNSSKGSELVI